MWKKYNDSKIYINEIIRITYKCNWKCKFCNVFKTNNFWEKDITVKEVIYQILNLTRKYTKEQRKNLILSFSWWEPTLDKNLFTYIRLAKGIWIWIIQIQTNWTILFKHKTYIDNLIAVWLDEIFLAQHSSDVDINNKLGIYYNIKDFINWVGGIKKNGIYKKIYIWFNIVITKINLFQIYDYLNFLLEVGFLWILPKIVNWQNPISFWLVQPNWYAEINKEEILLKYNDDELNEINKIIDFCKENNIYPDFHFTAPPLCILNYPEYNLEYKRSLNLEEDVKKWIVNEWNLESFKSLRKEKQKFKECDKCKYNNYCLWFYKNWISFIWEDYVKEKINNFIK